jgi:hypothetical protein
MDPLKGPSLHISSCSLLHRPNGAPNTSSYFMRNVGGKRESLSFYCPDRPLYTECGATSDVFSVHTGTCTVNTWALYVLYDLYGVNPPLAIIRPSSFAQQHSELSFNSQQPFKLGPQIVFDSCLFSVNFLDMINFFAVSFSFLLNFKFMIVYYQYCGLPNTFYPGRSCSIVCIFQMFRIF